MMRSIVRHGLELVLGIVTGVGISILISSCGAGRAPVPTPVAPQSATKSTAAPTEKAVVAPEKQKFVEMSATEALGSPDNTTYLKIVLRQDVKLIPSSEDHELGIAPAYWAYLQNGQSANAFPDVVHLDMTLLQRTKPQCRVQFDPFFDDGMAKVNAYVKLKEKTLSREDLSLMLKSGTKMHFELYPSKTIHDPETGVVRVTMFARDKDPAVKRLVCSGMKMDVTTIQQALGGARIYGLK